MCVVSTAAPGGPAQAWANPASRNERSAASGGAPLRSYHAWSLLTEPELDGGPDRIRCVAIAGWITERRGVLVPTTATAFFFTLGGFRAQPKAPLSRDCGCPSARLLERRCR